MAELKDPRTDEETDVEAYNATHERGHYGERRPNELIARVERDIAIARSPWVEKELDTTDSGHDSGQLKRYLEHHWGGDLTRVLKDPTRAKFGGTGMEDAKMWGDSVAIHYNLAAGNFSLTRQPLAFKVFRERPTTFTLTFTVALISPSWASEAGTITVTVTWQFGVGLTKTLLARTLSFTGAASFLDGASATLSDTINVPVMSCTASVSVGGVNNSQTGKDHDLVVAVFASPFVQ